MLPYLAAGCIAAIVTLIEVLTRYPDAPRRLVTEWAAWTYIGVHVAASFAALWLLNSYVQWSPEAMQSETVQTAIGTLAGVITIRIDKRRTTRGKYEYKVSHAIRTPEQLGPYLSSIPFGDTPQEALAKAIDDLTIFYSLGVQAGHEPAEDWLVRRPFR